MKTVYSPRHKGHSGHIEVVFGQPVPCFEKPERAEYIHQRIHDVGLGPVLAPAEHDLLTAAKVHKPDYLAFLPTVWDRWLAEGRPADATALPYVFPTRAVRQDVLPRHFDAQFGYYSFDNSVGFVAGTWDAIKSSHDVALTAVDLMNAGETSAFALCRPPGHHAGTDFMAGYCYINNAAVAAQRFLDQGARRVSILDVDYHHGNGTQQIFYNRADVQVINLHGHPDDEYPHFLGFADERGAGEGEGFNINYPMHHGTGWDVWSQALEDGCRKLADYQPDVVVVSLGVDTFEKDPISKFRLKTENYPVIGARIAKLGLPTLFVMEGGYAVAEIAVNAVGVLQGFEGA